METDKKEFNSIWWSWVIVTTLYIFFVFLFSANFTTNPLEGYITGFIGLFAPFGFLSVFLLFSNPLPLLFFIIAMIFIDSKLNKLNYSLRKRILINLFVLLILTTLIDFIRFTPFASWQLFFRHMDWNFGIYG